MVKFLLCYCNTFCGTATLFSGDVQGGGRSGEDSYKLNDIKELFNLTYNIREQILAYMTLLKLENNNLQDISIDYVHKPEDINLFTLAFYQYFCNKNIRHFRIKKGRNKTRIFFLYLHLR